VLDKQNDKIEVTYVPFTSFLIYVDGKNVKTTDNFYEVKDYLYNKCS